MKNYTNKKENEFTLNYVSSTEYYYEDEGEVAVELYNYKNEWINATCSVTAYHANKTKFIENETMIINIDSNVYYYKFVVPNEIGVYEYRVDCYWSNQHASRSKSWHVSNATTVIIDETVMELENIKNEIINTINSLPNYNNNFSDIINEINNIPDYTSTLIIINNKLDNIINNNNLTIGIQNNHTDELTDIQYKIDLLLLKFEIIAADLTINYDTIDCLEGSNWIMSVTVQNVFSQYLDDTQVKCNVTTNQWGTGDMIWDGNSFEYDHVCGYSGQIINWVIDCERI